MIYFNVLVFFSDLMQFAFGVRRISVYLLVQLVSVTKTSLELNVLGNMYCIESILSTDISLCFESEVYGHVADIESEDQTKGLAKFVLEKVKDIHILVI